MFRQKKRRVNILCFYVDGMLLCVPIVYIWVLVCWDWCQRRTSKSLKLTFVVTLECCTTTLIEGTEREANRTVCFVYKGLNANVT